MEDILKKAKSLEAAGLWINDNSKTIENQGMNWIFEHVIRYVRCYFIRTFTSF